MKALASRAKAQELEQAKLQVQEYEARVQVLRSVHADCTDPVDWMRLVNAPLPPEPVLDDDKARAARARLAEYAPGFFARVFGGAKTVMAQLEADLAEAEGAAQNEYARASTRWQQEVALIRLRQRIAEGVLAHEADTFREAVEHWDIFDELEGLGSAVEIAFLDANEAEVDLYVNDEEVIPSKTLSLLQNGKLSSKAMPQGQRLLLYQDYVCGSALRIARELFAVLPVQRVLVHAIADMMDATTGQIEAQPVLSSSFPRDTFTRLNFATLDASDSMKNFIHRMQFKKTTGFAAVEPLNRADLPTLA